MGNIKYRIVRPTEHNPVWMLDVHEEDAPDCGDFFMLSYRNLLSLGEACVWVLCGGYGAQITQDLRLDVPMRDATPRLNGRRIDMAQLRQLFKDTEEAIDNASNQR